MYQYSGGWIEIICGSMFSGKTEEMIRRVRRAQIARQKVQVFKPALDDRYHTTQIASHNGLQWGAVSVASAHEILERLDEDTTVVAMDEVQFFDWQIVRAVQRTGDARHPCHPGRPGHGFSR